MTLELLEIARYRKYHQLDFKHMSSDEIKELFSFSNGEKINFTELIRALIVRETYLNLIDPKEVRSFRNLWYEFKPILMRIEGIGVETEKWARRTTQKISSVLSDFVLAGKLSYEDLSIEDDSRKLILRNEEKNKAFSQLIIFIEKDSMFRRLKGVAEYYNATLISGHGFGSTASIEKILKKLNSNLEYTIIALTDYDAYGFQILEDFHVRSLKLGLNCDILRAGLNPDFFPADRLDFVKYPVPQKNEKDFIWAENYGIDGPYGLELDAVTDAHQFRQYLIDFIKSNYNKEPQYFKEIREDTKQRAKKPSAEEITESLLDNDIRSRMNHLVFRLYSITDILYQQVYDDILKKVFHIIDELSSNVSFDTRPSPNENSLHDRANQFRNVQEFYTSLLTEDNMKELFIPKGKECFIERFGEEIEIDEQINEYLKSMISTIEPIINDFQEKVLLEINDKEDDSDQFSDDEDEEDDSDQFSDDEDEEDDSDQFSDDEDLFDDSLLE